MQSDIISETATFTPENVDEFVRRFGRSDYGFLLEFSCSHRTETASVSIGLMLPPDSTELTGELTINFTGVRHFIYRLDRHAPINNLITAAINARFIEYRKKQYLFFDFAPIHTDDQCSVGSMYELTLEQFFESNGLVVSEEATWSLKPFMK